MRKNFHPPGKEVCAFFFFFFEDAEEQMIVSELELLLHRLDNITAEVTDCYGKANVFPKRKQLVDLLNRVISASTKCRKIVFEKQDNTTIEIDEFKDRFKDAMASDARIKESIVRATTRTTDSE